MNATVSKKPQTAAHDKVTGELLGSYLGDERARRISQRYLPSHGAIVEILESVLDLMYPGYFGRQDLSADNLSEHLTQMVAALVPKLEREMEHCLCYGREREAGAPQFGECAPRAHELAEIFLRRLPEIRGLLIRDVQAAFDGDPAALNLDEIILAYPGVLAVSVYRIAHALVRSGRADDGAHHDGVGAFEDRLRHSSRRNHRRGLFHRSRHRRGDRRDHAHRRRRQDLPGRHLGRAVAAAGCARTSHPRQEAPSDGGKRLDALRQRHRARRPDRGGRGQRHRRLGVPDAQRAAPFARLLEGTGAARHDARRRRGTRRDLLRYSSLRDGRGRYRRAPAVTSSCRAQAPAAARRC